MERIILLEGVIGLSSMALAADDPVIADPQRALILWYLDLIFTSIGRKQSSILPEYTVLKRDLLLYLLFNIYNNNLEP